MSRDNQPLDVKDAGIRPNSEQPKPAAESAAVEVPQTSLNNLMQTGRAAAKEVFEAEQQRLANEAKNEAKEFTNKRHWSAIKTGMYGAGLGIVGAAAATFFPVTAAFGGVALLAAGASAGAMIGSTMGYTLTGLDTQKLDSQITADNSRVGESMWKAFEAAVSQQVGAECAKHNGNVSYAEMERAFYDSLSKRTMNVDAAQETFGFPVTRDFLDRLALKNHSLKPEEEKNAHLTRMEPAPMPPVEIGKEEVAAATPPAPNSNAFGMTKETRMELDTAGQEFQENISNGRSLKSTRAAASVGRNGLSGMLE